jgi:uncharacterized iron-regulated protein
VQRRDFCGLLGGLALLPGCATVGAGGGGGGGEAGFFDTRSGERLARRRVLQRMAPAPIVLLGEVHDNAAHHRIRGGLLADWVCQRPSRPAVAIFEQLDREHNEALRLAQRAREAASSQGRPRACRRGDDASTEELVDLLAAARFDREAWAWPAHLPVFAAARRSGATWIAGNLSRASARRLSQDPAAAVDPALQAVVESARWSDDAQAALAQALREGHCNMLPEPAVAGVARIQRLRDAALALPLLDANERRSVLIAGNGHVRRDHGVPLYLGAYEYEALVIGFEEAAAVSPAAWVAQPGLAGVVGAGRALQLGKAYDLVCLTPVAPRDDPCERFTASGSLAPAGQPAVSPAAPTQTPSR